MASKERPDPQTILAQKRAGWAYLEAERRENLRKDAEPMNLAAFDTVFRYSLTLPPRTESGFTEFYRRLANGKKPWLT